jgi:hypothetical protein
MITIFEAARLLLYRRIHRVHVQVRIEPVWIGHETVTNHKTVGEKGAEYPTRFFARDYAGNRLEFSL